MNEASTIERVYLRQWSGTCDPGAAPDPLRPPHEKGAFAISWPAPLSGVPVTYALYSSAYERLYVGSTSMFRKRLRAHIYKGWPIYFWTATECPSREDAYTHERTILREGLPPMNRQAW